MDVTEALPHHFMHLVAKLREERLQALLGLGALFKGAPAMAQEDPCPVFGLAANHGFAEHLLSSGEAVFGSCAGVTWDMSRISW